MRWIDSVTFIVVQPGGRISVELSLRMQKARLFFANLRHLWHWRNIRLSTKVRVRWILFYYSETRLL